MYKYKTVYNVPDFKDSAGNWVLKYSPQPYLVHHTRAGTAWTNLLCRTNQGSSRRKESKKYDGCINKFINFNQFTDWCQSEYGYMEKDPSSKFWSLDKDILVTGNRIYSPDTCMFVPGRVNSLVSVRRSKESMIGTSKRIDGRYEAYCVDLDGKKQHLGIYERESDAHSAWCEYKSKLLYNFCQKDPQVLLHTKLKEAILELSRKIYDGSYTKLIYNCEYNYEYA